MAIKSGETTYHQAKRGIVQDGMMLNLDVGVGNTSTTSWGSLNGSRSMTLNNSPSIVRTEFGKSLLFDGIDDGYSMDDPNNDFVIDNSTVECVIKTIGSIPQGQTKRIFWKRRHSNGGSAPHWHVGLVGTGSNGSQPSLSSNGVVSSNNTFSYNVWQYLTFTTSGGHGGTTNIYNGGALVKTGTTFYEDLLQNGWPVYGGLGSATNGYYIPILRVYNHALTATEVLQNYNATRHRFGV
jgi:hypothetical protein